MKTKIKDKFSGFFSSKRSKRPPHLKQIIVDVSLEAGKDDIKRKAAALAYYGSLALAPFLVLAVSISGFFLGQEIVQAQIQDHLQEQFGFGVEVFVQNVFEGTTDFANNLLFSIVGLIVIFYAVFFIFNYLRKTFFEIFNFDFQEKEFLKKNIKKQASSLIFMFFAFLILLLILFFSLLSPLIEQLGKALFDVQSSLFLGEFWEKTASFTVVALLFSLIYRSTSGFSINWSSAFFGGIFASLLFSILNLLLDLYFSMTSDLAIYGAAGFFIVILLWLYYSGLILFLGAEIAKVYNRLDEKEKEII